MARLPLPRPVHGFALEELAALIDADEPRFEGRTTEA
jgi:hypothetical protein